MSDTVAQDTLGDQNPGGNNSLNRVRRQQLIHATIRIFTKHHLPLNSHGVNKLISRTDYVTGHKFTQDAHRIRIWIRRFQSKLFLRTAFGCEVILTLTICPLSAASGYEFLCLATVNIGMQINLGIRGGWRIRERDNILSSPFPRNDYVTGPQFTHDAYWIRIRIRGTKSKFFLSTVSGCGVILTFTTCLLSAASGHESFCLATVNLGT